MSNYSSSNKSWGSTGSEYPDGYNYLEGDQPVDAWDNFRVSNELDDIQHLIDLTNKRLESVSGTSHPTSPETGHLSYRTDSPSAGSGEQLFVYDGTNTKWRRFFMADGDQMEGNLDTGGYAITSTTGKVTVNNALEANGADLRYEKYTNHAGGTIPQNSIVNLYTFGLEDGETIHISQSSLTEDGFTSVCPSGIDLIVYDENQYADPANNSPDVVLSGDGVTLYDDEEGNPEMVSVTNTSGGHLTYAIGLDNGYFNGGVG
jgi:hypothetical protein